MQTGVHYHQLYSKTRPQLIRPRLPVTHWAPHDLRRSSRALLAAMGCPDSIAEAILGHMQSGIKGVYNRHSYDKERREWLMLLDARLEQIAKQGN
jgi:integrase